MTRAPELGDECRPGGSCPTCNAKVYYCERCGDEEVEERGDLCRDCAANDESDAAESDVKGV